MELINGEAPNPQTPQTQNPHHSFYDDDDLSDLSNCSTPYVSAPSSPGRAGPTVSGFFYSAPASPMHLLMTSSSTHLTTQLTEASAAEFEFSARFGSGGSGPTGPMSSADELFLDGKIRPMKLSTHLEQPQPGLIDPENEEGDRRGRDPRVLRSRRSRSMSPMRTMCLVSEIYSNNNAEFGKNDEDNENADDDSERKEELSCGGGGSGASSRSSSAGRNSKRWVFLKEFLHRSKSEGQQRSNTNINKLWGTNLFSGSDKESAKKANGVRRKAPSLHYTANRAQAEEMRKKTCLPYRQGLLGCLGFSSKGYGAAMNTGFARALNPVSSR